MRKRPVHAFLPPPTQVENVRLLDRVSPKRDRVGTLYLTATHSIFVENEARERKETWVGIKKSPAGQLDHII